MTTETPKMPGAYFTPPDPAAHRPGAVSVDSVTGRVSGYLTTSHTRQEYSQRSLPDPAGAVIPEAFWAPEEIATTTGPVRVGRLYAVLTGQCADPSLSADGARVYYRAVAQTVGWIVAGHHATSGMWVAGCVTAPSLSAAERDTLTRRSVLRADIRPADGRTELAAVYLKADARDLPSLALRHAITKGELLAMLTTGDLADTPDDTPLIMSKDGEGNDHSPLSGLMPAAYVPHCTWSGDVYPPDEVIDADDHYSDEDRAPEEAVRVIVLDPTN